MSLHLLEEEEYLGKIYDATIARRLGSEANKVAIAAEPSRRPRPRPAA